MFLPASSIVIGGLITILTAIVIEYYRRPKLEFEIANPVVKDLINCPVKKAKWLLVKVTNNKLPSIFFWMSRNPAIQCHGYITFYRIDGQKVFSNKMPIKWSNKPPSIAISVKMDNGQFINVIDPVGNYFAENIYPGESVNIDTVAKHDDDENCFGWTWENENTDPKKWFRNKSWELNKGLYLIKISIQTSGDKFEKCYRIINDLNFDNFRLESMVKNDPKLIDD